MVFFFYGENSYAVRRQIDAIARKYEQKTGTAYSLEIFDMTERSLGDFLNSIAVQPLFESSRLIIVKDLGANKVAREQIEQIIESIPDTTIIVIWEHEVDRRSKYFKVLAKLKTAQEFKLLDRPKLIAWLKRTAADYGFSIDNDALLQLVEYIGPDQWRLEQEIIKLGSYSERITKDAVAELVTASPELTIFRLIDAIWSKDTSGAHVIYEELLLQGSSDQQILAMLNWQLRNLVLAKESGGDYERISKTFSISPFVLRRAAQTARAISFDRLRESYRQLVAADFAIKSGRLNAKSALEELIFKLTAD